MFEKVNPSHPDKVADRIAGAIVDLAYAKQENPKIAVEVLIGHGVCHIIAESSVNLELEKIKAAVKRIAGDVSVDYVEVPQDIHLAGNQKEKVRCGDNGIFKGVYPSVEEKMLSLIAKDIYFKYPTDGKYILDNKKLIVCQSNVNSEELKTYLEKTYRGIIDEVIVNPLGDWTGGTDVDTGATNRKLGSDMGRSVTGGGLHGKDLSKADVSVNIYAFCKSKFLHKTIELSCAIGDDKIDGVPYEVIVRAGLEYINAIGGFEKFAEWGLI